MATALAGGAEDDEEEVVEEAARVGAAFAIAEDEEDEMAGIVETSFPIPASFFLAVLGDFTDEAPADALLGALPLGAALAGAAFFAFFLGLSSSLSSREVSEEDDDILPCISAKKWDKR